MKLISLIMLLVFTFISTSALADVEVKSYYRKDGTYVEPHYRSDPNNTPADNWSTKGNINPHTGQEGTKDYNRGY